MSVRRGSVAQDGFDRLEGADLKAPIEITFIDQFGQEECVDSLSFTIDQDRETHRVCVGTGLALTVGESSKSSSRRSVKRYSTPIGDCG